MKAKIWNKTMWIKQCEPALLKSKFSDLLYTSGFNVINFQQHFFYPIGWTGLWLLGESHLAIHTFPEEGKSYLELSSCNKEKYKSFIANAGNYIII